MLPVRSGVVSVLLAALIMPLVTTPPVGGVDASEEEATDPRVRAFALM